MGLRAWLTGSARTALRDSRLYLSEWQWLMDYLEEQRGLLGDLTTSSGGSITDAIDGVTSAQSQAFSALSMNVRIETDDTNPTHVINLLADGLGIEDAYVQNLDKLVDVAASGLLGLDTGTEAIDTWYFVWVGYDPDTQNTTAIFSESFTKGGLTLSGALAPYTKWRRVGARRNNHVGDLIPATQYGRRVLYDARYDTLYSHASTPGLKALSGGTATTLTAVPLDSLVPPIGTVPVDVGAQFSGGTAAFLYPGNTVLDGSTAGPIVINSAVTTSSHPTVTDDGQGIYYKVAGGGATIDLHVIGYEDTAA